MHLEKLSVSLWAVGPVRMRFLQYRCFLEPLSVSTSTPGQHQVVRSTAVGAVVSTIDFKFPQHVEFRGESSPAHGFMCSRRSLLNAGLSVRRVTSASEVGESVPVPNYTDGV